MVEPHPLGDPSPYGGQPWESRYSTLPQPMSYGERVGHAQQMLPELEGNQRILVDDLTPGGMNNPLWCTYGTCPNCAFLIGQDGILQTVQTWLDVEGMRAAMDALLGK